MIAIGLVRHMIDQELPSIGGALAAPKSSAHLLDPDIARGMASLDIESLVKAPTLEEVQAANPNLSIEERSIDGEAGQPPVRIVVFSPRHQRSGRPAWLEIHGGGYIRGTPLDQHASIARTVRELDCVAVSVDYRLAPATPFPGALLDNYAALGWMHKNSAALGIDPARIAIKGGSAGGGHAAMLARYARDRGEYPILMQILIVPMLDDRTGVTRDPGPYAGEFVWTREMNRIGWSALLGVEAGSNEVPEGASPGRWSDLEGMPPTFITTGALDLFVQENLEFASRLLRAGVHTELHVWDGIPHGGPLFAPDGPMAKAQDDTVLKAMKLAFERAA